MAVLAQLLIDYSPTFAPFSFLWPGDPYPIRVQVNLEYTVNLVGWITEALYVMIFIYSYFLKDNKCNKQTNNAEEVPKKLIMHKCCDARRAKKHNH